MIYKSFYIKYLIQLNKFALSIIDSSSDHPHLYINNFTYTKLFIIFEYNLISKYINIYLCCLYNVNIVYKTIASILVIKETRPCFVHSS